MRITPEGPALSVRGFFRRDRLRQSVIIRQDGVLAARRARAMGILRTGRSHPSVSGRATLFKALSIQKQEIDKKRFPSALVLSLLFLKFTLRGAEISGISFEVIIKWHRIRYI